MGCEYTNKSNLVCNSQHYTENIFRREIKHGQREHYFTVNLDIYVCCLFDLSTGGAVYKWDPNLVITVAADGLAPDGARQSADTALTA